MNKVDASIINSANEFEKAERYWLNNLAGDLPELRLMSDFPDNMEVKRESFLISINNDLSQRLLKISKKNHLSIYIFFLTGFKILLQKFTDQDEVVLTSPLFNIENNKYNKYIIFRDLIDPSLTFKEILMQVRETVIEGYKNEYYPVENIIETLYINESSLFRYTLVLENIHGKEFFEEIPINRENDICLSFQEKMGCLQAKINYNAYVFKQITIRTLFDCFMGILDQVLSEINIKISEIHLIKDLEKKRILYEFNLNKREFPADKMIHQLFQEQVRKTPGNIAVRSTLDERNVYDKSTFMKLDIYLDYNELNERANQLGHELRAKGVTADTIVGVLLTHPLEVVITILGILKSGGAYLPLDIHHPKKYIELIIQNSSMQWLVTEESLEDKIPDSASLGSILIIDNDSVNDNRISNLKSVNIPSSLAYVIYTSGTTGEPKGTLIEHRGVVNYTWWRIKSYQYVESDVTLQPLSYCFDGFTSNFYSSLNSGGTLFMVPDFKRMDFQYLKEVIRDYKVSNISLVPGSYNAILEISKLSDLESLRFVVLAGDSSSSELVKKSKEKAPGALLINEYGPTEATVTATANLEITEKNTAIIGKPISNISIYILDRFLEPVPINIAGEMYISGVGLAREYLGNPQLTNEKFLTNPFCRGERLYKTGDFSRWLPNGEIEFLGRIDTQVKTRGFRVELKQIENTLLNHEQINDVVVMAIDKRDIKDINEKSYDKYLCAYVVSIKQFKTIELKEYLKHKLPEYMIPAHFISLKKIPLTKNGKKDLKALANIDISQRNEDQIPPRNKVEECLARIWSEVLRISEDKIFITSNFFDLGGHSLNATTVIYKIHKTLDVKISVVEMFDNPTIKDLSEKILSKSGGKYISIQPVEKLEYYPLSSAQKRLFILNQMDSCHNGYNVSQLIPLKSTFNKNILEAAFRKLIQRHRALRTSFRVLNGEPIQQIHDEVRFFINYFEVKCEQVDDIINNLRKPFDLGQAPLLRVAVINILLDYPLLMVESHHIITDAFTRDLLIRDFLNVYNEKQLSKLRLQYNDYVLWQNQQKKEKGMHQEEKYWLDVFKSIPPPLEISFDFVRPALKSFEGNVVSYDIGVEMMEALKKIANRVGATMFMLIFAIFNVLLSKLCNSEDLTIGTPISGRSHADLENIAGLFANTLPLRNYSIGEISFELFLKNVKNQTLSAFENQSFQFEDLIDQLVIERDTSRNPLFDIMFVYEKIDEQPAVFKQENVFEEEKKYYSIENNISKFDLTLIGTETSDGISFKFEYCTKLFKQETLERFVEYFKIIISTIITNPLLKISDITLINTEEKKILLYDLNETYRNFPVNKTILDLFETQVDKTPNNQVAVEKSESIIYGKLKERINDLAIILKGKGICPNDVVPIMMDHSIELLIGILGILKAGGAFLPIDPEYPKERKFFMLEDCKAKVLITSNGFFDFENKTQKIQQLSIQNNMIIDMDELETKSPTNNKIPKNPKDLAYVIYTSGSTGNPKGVMVEHQGLTNYIIWATQNYVRNEKVNFPLYTSISFDLTITSIFAPLTTGNAVVIYRETEKEFLIEKIIDDNKVGVVKLTPAHLKLIKFKKLENSKIKRLIVGGENLEKDLAFTIHKNSKGKIEIYNEYGPTESIIGCMIFKFDPNIKTGKSVPIGRPIDNTKIYILGKNQEPIPYNVPGELYVSGFSLAKGYLGNVELTFEKFVKNPFVKDAIMYKTSDMCRWLPQGDAEFLGRLDQQVKIRGYRIEVGEIESKLLSYKCLENAVVIPREEKGKERYLCAYFVSKKELTELELKEFLAKKIPQYMIPAHFVRINNIPLTINGKVDKKKLPAPGKKILTYVAPHTEVEMIVAGIWKDVLHLDKIGIHDNFFDIGGNSIELVKVVEQLKKILKRDIPIMMMFEHSTIRSFTKNLQDRKIEDQSKLKERETVLVSKIENSMKETVQLFDEIL